MLDQKGTHTVVNLYSDSCAGQNRTRAMISMLIYFLKTAITITQIKVTYLLPGHTMMPVDSIHSTVESFVRNKTVWAPSEWPTMITNVRCNPKSYIVNVLNFGDFMDWRSFSQALLPAKFKINGHSHMECDSDHADIERTKKKTHLKINHLNDWIQLVRLCKLKNAFEVMPMQLELNSLNFSNSVN